jgi:predicted ATP-dependent endonuclease of OLD family
MNILYLNNYKGFISEYLPFQDVNFFVGDNSTGKTSVISLITEIEKGTFWSDFLKKSNFEEFLNQSTKENFFRIGWCSQETSAKSLDAICLKFTNEATIFQIAEVKFIYQGVTYFAQKTDNEFVVRQFDSSKCSTLEEFKQWIDIDNSASKPSKKIANKKVSIIEIIKEVVGKEMRPLLFSNFVSKPPVQEAPKNIYQNADYDLFSNLEFISKAGEVELNEFGKKSGLFDRIKFEWLRKDEEYIIKTYHRNVALTLNNVGYGISQILPLLLDMLSFRKYTLAFQQPEVHLHPKAQAEFGEFVYNTASRRHDKFIIETHSDYLIDRYRFCLNRNSLSHIPSQIVFFKKNDEGNNEIQIISILEDGSYEDCAELFEFRDFFINEQMSLLEM